MAKKKKKKKEPADNDEKAKGDAEPKESVEKGGEAAEAREGSETAGGRRFPILTLVEVAVAVGVLAGLVFVVHWLAAVSIASALFVFLDAAINHVNRIKPSSEESRVALLTWSLVGFVPFVGIVVYAVVRRKLASAPVTKIATGKEAVETVKRRMRAVPIPTAVVVAAAAVAVALLSLKGPFTIQFGTNYTRGLNIEGTTSNDTYTVGTVCIKLVSAKPIKGYANLDWKLYLGGSDVPTYKGTVPVSRESDKKIWVWKVRARYPGDYRLDVINSSGKIVKRGYFTAVPKTR